MKIVPGCRVRLHYTLSSEDLVVDSTEGRPPLEVIIGSGQLHPALESQLVGLGAGERVERVLDPNMGFGDYDPQLKIQVARRKLPEKWQTLSQGLQFETLDPYNKLRVFRVVQSTEAFIVIDGNHPLAGQTLYLDAEIVSVEGP